MHTVWLLNGFHFHDHPLFNNDIETVAAVQPVAIKDDR